MFIFSLFQNWKQLQLIYVTFAIDVVVFAAFTVEMVIKIMKNGLFKAKIKVQQPTSFHVQ